jgi:hypothetical protein
MNTLMMKLLTVIAVLIGVSACGGGGGGSSDTTDGTLSIAITDAPADDALEVWVRFTGMTLKPQNGPQDPITFATPVDVDLASLTDGNTVTLLNDVRVAAGRYEWIRFEVDAEFDDNFDYSYVVTSMGGEEDLKVPSDRLRLVSGFVVTVNQNTSFVIDWDLRKGLTNPVGLDGWFLRPALRIVDMTEYGSISGTVADSLTSDSPGEPPATQCNNDPNDDSGNVVYVFEDVVTADDITTLDDTDVDPLTTANVRQDDGGIYRYSVAFLSPGEYTIAFTCQGLSEDPETDDPLLFVSDTVTVVDGEDRVYDFVDPGV